MEAGNDVVLKGSFNNEADWNRISTWRGGRVKKAKLFHREGGSCSWDDGLFDKPLPEITKLPAGWEIDDNGYFTCNFPAIEINEGDFAKGELKAYPAHLATTKILERESGDGHFEMDAGHAGSKFHQWISEHVPDFDDAYHYKRSENMNKVWGCPR